MLDSEAAIARRPVWRTSPTADKRRNPADEVHGVRRSVEDLVRAVQRTEQLAFEDVDEVSKKLEDLGARHYIDQGAGGHQAGYFEKKFYGPEGVLFDIAEHGWAGAEPLPAETVKEAAE